MSLHRIDEIFNFEKGSLQSSKCETGQYNFITASADWKTHKEFTYDCEALVFAAAAAGSLGRTHYVNDKFIASDLCFILTPKDAENFPVDLEFYHLIFRELRQDIVKNTKAGTSKESISLGSFARYELPYFDIERQTKIKGRFVEAELTKTNLSGKLDHQLALVKDLRQAYLREAMQGKLVPQDPTDEPAEILLEKIRAEKEKLVAEKRIKRDKPLPPIDPGELPFEIPSKWTWCKLGDLTTLITKGSSPKWQGIRYLDSAKDGVLFLTSKNVGSYNLLLSEKDFVEERFNEIEPRSILQKGDLLTNIVGASIGRTALFDLEEIANINQAVCLMRLGHDFVNTIYLLHYFNSSLSIEQMFEKQFAPGRANLSMGDLANFHVPLPPLAEQERIVAKLEKLMKFCDQLEANIKQGITNADRLLQTALREALEPRKYEAKERAYRSEY